MADVLQPQRPESQFQVPQSAEVAAYQAEQLRHAAEAVSAAYQDNPVNPYAEQQISPAAQQEVNEVYVQAASAELVNQAEQHLRAVADDAANVTGFRTEALVQAGVVPAQPEATINSQEEPYVLAA